MPSALTKPIYNNVIRYLGDAGIPHEILRRRRAHLEMMRRMGTPVLVKKMFNIEDTEGDEPIATYSPNWDTNMRQPMHDDPFSYGVGYVSVQTAPGEWTIPANEEETASLIITDNPEPGWLPAPMYRGYGPGFLTYAILPDAPEDIFKHTEEGLLLHTQQARVQLPWHPELGDNDLMIMVELDATENIIQTFERFELKKVSPITMRGRDRWGRREGTRMIAGGNRFTVGAQCELSKVPETDPIYNVETDR